MTSLPVIDLSKTAAHRGSISDAIKSLGFLALKSPETPSSSQLAEIFRIAEDFFLNETQAEKERCGITVDNKGWIKKRQESRTLPPKLSGWTPRNIPGEITKTFNIAHYSSSNEPSQPLPALLDSYRKELGEFMHACHLFSMRLLEEFAFDMGLAGDYFTSRHAWGVENSSILRLLYYPPTGSLEAPSLGKDVRAGAHSDYGTLTLLFQKEVGGLQILLPKSDSSDQDKWLDVPVIPDSVLVNIGDAFDFWSGGRYPSTQHRVIAPRNSEENIGRFSIAYFLQPADDEPLERIPESGTVQEDERSVVRRFGVESSAKLTAKEWLIQRLGSSYSDRKLAS